MLHAPAAVITLPLEGTARIYVDALNEEEANRLGDWLSNGRPEIAALFEHAVEVAGCP